jgi:hypothetical protein
MGDLRGQNCSFEHEPGMRPGWLRAVLAFFVGCGSDLRSLLVGTLFRVYVAKRHHYRNDGIHRLCRGAANLEEAA